MASTKNPVPIRLREARKAAGLSQKKLGIAAGIDEFSASARLNQYETGKHSPDYLTLKRVAKILKVPCAYFYADDEVLGQILFNFAKLNKTQQDKILKLSLKLLKESKA